MGSTFSFLNEKGLLISEKQIQGDPVEYEDIIFLSYVFSGLLMPKSGGCVRSFIPLAAAIQACTGAIPLVQACTGAIPLAPLVLGSVYRMLRDCHQIDRRQPEDNTEPVLPPPITVFIGILAARDTLMGCAGNIQNAKDILHSWVAEERSDFERDMFSSGMLLMRDVGQRLSYTPEFFLAIKSYARLQLSVSWQKLTI